MSLQQLLVDHGILTRYLNDREFAVCCWKCGDTKFHMSVNPTIGWCYCHRRGCKASVAALCKHFGITFIAQEPITSPVSLLVDKFKQAFTPVKKTDNTTGVVLDVLKSTHAIAHSDSIIAGWARNYLNKRRITNDQIAHYDLRFSADTHTGRIIIPFYENSSLVYYQARQFMNMSALKVVNPTEAEVAKGKSNWLFGFDIAKQFREVIICEGWASVISAGYDAVGIQGSVVSDIQFKKLVTHWKKFVVMLDAGALEQANNLCYRLLPYGEVRIVILETGDPNDYERPVIQAMINKAKLYNPLEVSKILCAKL